MSNHFKTSIGEFIAPSKLIVLMLFAIHWRESFVSRQPTMSFTTMKLQTPHVDPHSTKSFPQNTKISTDNSLLKTNFHHWQKSGCMNRWLKGTGARESNERLRTDVKRSSIKGNFKISSKRADLHVNPVLLSLETVLELCSTMKLFFKFISLPIFVTKTIIQLPAL